MQQIQSNPQTFYTAGEMAEAHFICARTLNNRFRKACQKTFYAYQMETRLEMAGHFLTHQPEVLSMRLPSTLDFMMNSI